MALLPQLISPDTYRPCDWDLQHDASGRDYWANLFCDHLELLTDLIAAEYPAATAEQIEAFRRDYLTTIRAFQHQPEQYASADVLQLTSLRRGVQQRHRFHDPFHGIKQRENDAALALLPQVLAELDAARPEAQFEALAAGLMAGNLFDLGSDATIDRYHDGSLDFHHACAEQPARPWFIDDADIWHRHWLEGPGYRHVLFFVDNAGSDICLGCLPLARWMLRAGGRVTLAANSGPALNDITAAELTPLLTRAAATDAALRDALASRQLRVVPSGNNLPLLDLRELAPQCAAAAGDADLIIFHGMGRAIESNFHTHLRCDALWTAVLKDPAVTHHVGGQMFDCIFRYRRGTRPVSPDDDAK